MTLGGFSMQRFWAVATKEFIQMRRDRLTFAMMVGIPLMQILLFGFAINSDPKNLPAAIISADNGPQVRTLLFGLRNSGYLRFVDNISTQSAGEEALARGKIQFLINIPENFTRELLRGEQPNILIEVDATDPVASNSAIGAMRTLIASVLNRDLKGSLSHLIREEPIVNLQVHALYNPDNKTQYNIVPGLMGVVLTMTMVLITGLAITRERESGTMENLLSMPTRPLEVLVGKIVPYVLVGYVQITVVMIAARLIFDVPMIGNIPLLFFLALFFIAANLSVGITFSTIAKNQRQAMQMAMFFFLPSILLSGFMFPFRGMPDWAQYLGEVLPLTHFLRIVRGILLKGNGFADVAWEIWPILLFTALTLTLGVKRYRQTLD